MSDQQAQPQQPPAPTPPAQPTEDRRSGGDTIQDRIKRAKRTAVNALLSEMGFDNVDSLKSAVQTARTAQSSIEAEHGKVTTLEGEKSTLQQALAQIKAEQYDGAVNNAIIAAVSTTTVKAQYPQDVVEHLRKNHADALKAAFNEKAEADAAKLSALIDQVKKDRPAWFGPAGAGSPSNLGGKALGPDAASRDARQRASITNQRLIRG